MKKLIKNSVKKTHLYKVYIDFRVRYERQKICLTPKKQYIKDRWESTFNKKLNLENPTTFNEKIQWSKLYANNNLAKLCADKIKVLDYVQDKIGSEYINEIIAIYPNTKNIDFSKLPQQFVLKANHDSGSVLIVKDHNNVDFDKLKCIERNLKINYGRFSKEWVYDDIKPQIIIEKFLESEDGKSLKDYKIFCFNGQPKIIQVDLERFEGHRRNLYDTNWDRLDLEIENPNADYDVEKPELLNEMLEMTEILAKPFNHVRVDWYIHKDRLIFGEMTFFHGSGFQKFNSLEWEEKMGSWFEISEDLSY